MIEFDTQLGEAFIGSGGDAAHVNTVLGAKGGPVETAWAMALATPRPGNAAFVTVVQPGLAVKPLTLFVNKATIGGEQHSRLTWGAAQAGVAGGVLDAVAEGFVDPALVDDLLLIAAVWVDPAASGEDSVYANNREATRLALLAGRDRRPAIDDLLAARANPFNPFFHPPG
ncbi:MAG TPA: formaldehyde-activating enzyme [Acidimicrobiales bacterium]|nr:formaldehyde-activating enzyme [Acidimicrobiales bacterium]